MKERRIPYRGREITVYFNPDRCTHVAECLMGAPEVFDSGRRPWVEPDAASPDLIAEVVRLCPTGALHFDRRDGGEQESVPDVNRIFLWEDGPFVLLGNIRLTDVRGNLLLEDTRVALCRCGESGHMPHCDGVHAIVDFQDDGTVPAGQRQAGPLPAQPVPLTVSLQPNGPLKLSGPMHIIDVFDHDVFQGTRALLCRCGASKQKPFCDGTHSRIGFVSE